MVLYLSISLSLSLSLSLHLSLTLYLTRSLTHTCTHKRTQRKGGRKRGIPYYTPTPNNPLRYPFKSDSCPTASTHQCLFIVEEQR